MANEAINLKVEVRKPGKHISRALRRSGHVPAVIYGPKMENMDVSVVENQLARYMKQKFENSIFTFESPDKKLQGLKVLKKAVTLHPVTRRPTHVDFYALDLTKAVRVYVEVRFEGKPDGLRDGGLLSLINREVEIECLPTAIPPFIPVDVTPLGVGDSLHVSDIQPQAGVKILSSLTTTLCTVSIVEEEKAAPVAAAAPAEGAAAAPAADGAAAPAAGGAAAGAAAPKAAAPKKDEKKG
jgi:large subunit ribosomal protein L25